MGWLDSFEGDARTGPRCPDLDPLTQKRCALDAGHEDIDYRFRFHKCAIPFNIDKAADKRGADVRIWE